jgi:hypothetical protein
MKSIVLNRHNALSKGFSVTGRFNRNWIGVVACMPLLAGAVIPASAAPILGENQDEEELVEPASTPIVQPTELRADAVVIQFSVLPSPANPDRFETTIIVQQDGGRTICVNHTSPVIIVRSYQTDDDPFVPDIPSPIEGQDSGDVGDLAGFNSKKIFIRPRGPEDRFELADEPFRVGQFEGVFRRDEIECDQELTEGDFACLDEVIRTYNCDLSRHASLVRDLRVAIALNSTQTIAPAADSPLNSFSGNDFSSSSGTVPPSSGSTGAAPSFSGSFGGSGGDGLILVPDVIGLPIENAESLITAIGFTVGSVTRKNSSASLLKGLIISTAYAQSPCITTNQFPPANERRPAGTQFSLECQIEAASAVPEPSSSSIFILGLLALVGTFWFSRRRSHTTFTRA